ncbi:conserved hypothetical protein [Ricinus communis]|uniref:Uncharacterized protein n=1 Tax=Ricinus communis TaxID=3988 RepID=B9S2V2_RICCO|nr:conserved hypothetical protein [Ricinus communis]
MKKKEVEKKDGDKCRDMQPLTTFIQPRGRHQAQELPSPCLKNSVPTKLHHNLLVELLMQTASEMKHTRFYKELEFSRTYSPTLTPLLQAGVGIEEIAKKSYYKLLRWLFHM